MDWKNRAWEQFLHTGKVGDYLRYRQAVEAQVDEDWMESGECPDADDNTSGGDRYSRYQ